MNVLIVDDNEDNRMTIKLLLEEFDDLNISEAEDGQKAIDYCLSEPVDIVFMDIMMPNVNGIDATKEIKANNHDIMVLALSALDDVNSKNDMLAVGAEDYMTKPIESELFHQRVKNYLQIISFRKKTLSNENALNPFTTEVYARSLKFNFTNMQSIAEFWDYYLNNKSIQIEALEECIRMIYAYAQIMLKNHKEFTVIEEENDDNIYFILSPISHLSENVIKNTLLKYYDQAIYIFENKHLSFRLPKNSLIGSSPKEIKKVSSLDKKILSKTHFNKVTAAEYIESTAVSLIDKVENLEEIETGIESEAIAFEQHRHQEALVKITDLLASYIEVIQQLMDFEHLAYALNTLNQFLKTLDVSETDPKDTKKFSLIFLHLLDDISSWRKNIFILQEANDIHYLDSSLLSSCIQVQTIFDKVEVEQDDEDDFELF